MPSAQTGRYDHEALLHRGDAEFLDAALPIIDDALATGVPVVACLSTPRAALLGRAVADRDMAIADMGVVGRNPARIIPWWRRAVAEVAPNGERVCAFGEPVWAGRSEAELAECHEHESLLNLAFAGSNLRLLCPYDVEALAPADVEAARRNHPVLVESGESRPSAAYIPPVSLTAAPLPAPPRDAIRIDVGAAELAAVRRTIADAVAPFGLPARRADDLVLAVHELVANSVEHGSGRAHVVLWVDGDRVVGDVVDTGPATFDPLVGRVQPRVEQERGRGLWLVNQLCDLVQIRPDTGGTNVRVHVDRA